VDCPEAFVVPAVKLRVPTVALQLTALLASEVPELSFNVAVSVVELPLWTVKLEGAMVKEVEVGETEEVAGDMVPVALTELAAL
jgi:hypothetical protein